MKVVAAPFCCGPASMAIKDGKETLPWYIQVICDKRVGIFHSSTTTSISVFCNANGETVGGNGGWRHAAILLVRGHLGIEIIKGRKWGRREERIGF